MAQMLDINNTERHDCLPELCERCLQLQQRCVRSIMDLLSLLLLLWWRNVILLFPIIGIHLKVHSDRLITHLHSSKRYRALCRPDIIKFHTKVSWVCELIYFAELSELGETGLHVGHR
jgi:hypothetical protein